MSKILILGAGAMGTAFSVPCLDRQHQVKIVGTHLEENVTVDASGVSDDYVGACYDFGESCFNRDRVNLALRYYRDDWSVSLLTRFLSKIDVSDDVKEYFAESPYGDALPAGWQEEVFDIHSIPRYSVSSLSVGYNLSDSVMFNFGVQNLFDKKPPYYKDFFGFVDPQINTPQNTYDIVGRYYTLGFRISY